MKCEWCGKEFAEGGYYIDIFKHLVGCFNAMMKEYKKVVKILAGKD